jgi:hypothetical protein
VTGVVLAFILSSNLHAAEKQPWEWTPAERAQARLDPAKRLERLRANGGDRREGDVIDGNRNPELYFATELFEYLVRSAFVTLPTVYPKVVRQRSSDLFVDPAEWERFSAIVADYANVLRQEEAAVTALDKATVSALRSKKCPAEARALRAARRAFGRTRFDRMLYEIVPSSRKTAFGADGNLAAMTKLALDREERCQ